MLALDPKLTQALAPLLSRVLIVDGSQTSAQMLAGLLANTGRSVPWRASTTSQGLSVAQSTDPRLIFVEHDGDGLNGLAFTRKLRRSEFSCRKAPVIMVTALATPAVILAARDSGVHEFLRKPFTNNDLLRRLEAVALHPRDWVEAVDYIGPDRRRFNSAEFSGRRKRQLDSVADATPEKAKILQALKIVAAAPAAIEANPTQVCRSLNTQAAELRRAAEATSNAELAAAASGLQAYLVTVARGAPLTWGGLAPLTDRLLTFLPKPKQDAAA